MLLVIFCESLAGMLLLFLLLFVPFPSCSWVPLIQHHHHHYDSVRNNHLHYHQHFLRRSITIQNLSSKKSSSTSSSSSLPPPNKEFQKQLKLIPSFSSVLIPKSDLGYYQWTPSGKTRRSLKNVTAQEIRDSCMLEKQPKQLVDLKLLNEVLLPINYTQGQPPWLQQNKYPYGQTLIASLYAATQKGLDMQSIDFVFGSYTLNFFAKEHIEPDETFVVAKLPGTQDTVLATRYKEYTQDYSRVGFAFERLIQGEKMSYVTLDNVEHLQVMQIDQSAILFAGEADAIDSQGNPVEIKSFVNKDIANRALFQMICSGCSRSVLGKCKFRGRNGNRRMTINSVQQETLANCARFCSHLNAKSRRIVKHVRRLQRYCRSSKQLKPGEVKQVVFEQDKRNKRMRYMRIVPCSNVTIHDLFPNTSVVEELLIPTK